MQAVQKLFDQFIKFNFSHEWTLITYQLHYVCRTKALQNVDRRNENISRI